MRRRAYTGQRAHAWSKTATRRKLARREARYTRNEHMAVIRDLQLYIYDHSLSLSLSLLVFASQTLNNAY